MPDIDGERPGVDVRRGRRTNWPLWLLVPLGIFGLVAVTQLGDRPAEGPFQGRPAGTQVVFQGRALSSAGAAEVAYPDAQMVRIGATEGGIALYRRRVQPGAGGGGGAGAPIYMRTGAGTYLPLTPVARPSR